MKDGQIVLDERVATGFGVGREAMSLGGTEQRAFRAGDVVLRRVDEDRGARWEAALTARVYHLIDEKGFRVSRPLRAADGRFVVAGWSAWTYIEGWPATPRDAGEVAVAIDALHAALARIPGDPRLAHRSGPYARAERQAWEEEALPRVADPRVAGALGQLLAKRRPIQGLTCQLIHPDLNFHNILIAPGLTPAFVDLGVDWRPPEYGVAIAAYWLGPYQGDTSILRHFDHTRELPQLLVRVALRQLLILANLGDFRWADEFCRAAEIVGRLAKDD